MTIRTTRDRVSFAQPFVLRGAGTVHPPGTYTVETDEELMEGLSFPAYRRVATTIFLPLHPGGSGSGEVLPVDPGDLAAALDRDARHG